VVGCLLKKGLKTREPLGETVKDSESRKVRIFTRILPELYAAAPYFSIVAVKRRLVELQVAIAEGSLLHYLSDAVERKIIYGAGQGWYSRLEQSLTLSEKPLAHLIRLVSKEFPLLEFCCWSTQQINPFTHHILAKHTVFLYADGDALPSVADFLRAEKWDALTDPNKADVRRLHRPGERSVILRPAISKQPQDTDHLAPPEKVLVDLQIEADAVMLMDRDEANTVLRKAVSSGRINIASLMGYAKRRRVDIACEDDSLGPQVARLWSE